MRPGKFGLRRKPQGCRPDREGRKGAPEGKRADVDEGEEDGLVEVEE